jgi:hypothetical protein
LAQSSKLSYLNMSRCSLTGSIPPFLCGPPPLDPTHGFRRWTGAIDLSNNYLSGTIPPVWGNQRLFSVAGMVNLSYNLLIGSLPAIATEDGIDVTTNGLWGNVPILPCLTPNSLVRFTWHFCLFV